MIKLYMLPDHPGPFYQHPGQVDSTSIYPRQYQPAKSKIYLISKYQYYSLFLVLLSTTKQL